MKPTYNRENKIMKRLTSLGTITLTLLLASISGVGASETNQTNELSSHTANNLLAAKAETSGKLVTSDRQNQIENTFAILEAEEQRRIELSEDFKMSQKPD